jgi:hypothetical protein
VRVGIGVSDGVGVTVSAGVDVGTVGDIGIGVVAGVELQDIKTRRIAINKVYRTTSP